VGGGEGQKWRRGPGGYENEGEKKKRKQTKQENESRYDCTHTHTHQAISPFSNLSLFYFSLSL
jgi:hypothetical protein